MAGNIYRDTIEQPSDRVIVALDNMNWSRASMIMGEVGDHVGMGKANSIAQKKGWEHAVQTIADLGSFTMLDQKYHDIPETVRLHVKEAMECGPRLITVHASSKPEMLKKAVEGRDEGKKGIGNAFMNACKDRLGGILGVTVLTSLDSDECISIYGDTPEKKVLQFAHAAAEQGIDGIVCSGKELTAIRADSALDGLLAVVPGITPEWTKKAGDQKRIVTPSEAVQSGADFIVVGRAITQPPEGITSREAAEKIEHELMEAL